MPLMTVGITEQWFIQQKKKNTKPVLCDQQAKAHELHLSDGSLVFPQSTV